MTSIPRLKKGDRVQIRGNTIFRAMGYERLTGSVFLVYSDGHGIALRCEETKAMELVSFGDGEIKILSQQGGGQHE